MRFLAPFLALSLALIAPLQAGSVSDRLYGAVATSEAKVYTVRTQTDVTIPTKGPSCHQVRVWHAIAAYKPWSNTSSPLGANDLRSAPTGKIEAEDDKRSAHFYFEENRQFVPGTQLRYVSSYKAVSVKRSFNPSSFRCSWADCQQFMSKDQINSPNKLGNDPEVVALAVKLKQNHDPANTVIEFCRWLKTNIDYDESVPHRTDDLATTLKKRRGHCGHTAQLLHGLCRSVGLKSRDVVGVNLTEPNGKKTSRPDDWGNTHNWAEVYFPNIGWIEIEPTNGEKCFTIPSSFIQNNTSFQNSAVWVSEPNANKQATWSYKDGRYQCDYNVITRITFSESRL